MAQFGFLKVKEGEAENTLKEILREWLVSGKVSALLVPAISPTGVCAPVLISDAQKIGLVSPFLPVMSINSASVVAQIAGNMSKNERLGVILKPCEMRAVVELIKLQQIQRENIILIGIDCPGTYNPEKVKDKVQEGGGSWVREFLQKQENYLTDSSMRRACRMCEYPTPLVYDLAIGFLGMDVGENLLLESHSDLGDSLMDGISIERVESSVPERERFLKEFIQVRKKEAEERIAEFDAVGLGAENLVRYFAHCVNCHNCMKVCPICYCKQCFFDSESLKRDLDDYIRLSKRKGLNRMPPDTILFHLTRMAHMMISCVQCGVCEDSCPRGIGLSVIFKKVSRNAQAEFGYLSGRSLEEPLPLVVFREDEFREVGEE